MEAGSLAYYAAWDADGANTCNTYQEITKLAHPQVFARGRRTPVIYEMYPWCPDSIRCRAKNGKNLELASHAVNSAGEAVYGAIYRRIRVKVRATTPGLRGLS